MHSNIVCKLDYDVYKFDIGRLRLNKKPIQVSKLVQENMKEGQSVLLLTS